MINVLLTDGLISFSVCAQVRFCRCSALSLSPPAGITPQQCDTHFQGVAVAVCNGPSGWAAVGVAGEVSIVALCQVPPDPLQDVGECAAAEEWG